KRLRLILKTIADVGLVGLPNAGKSTLLSQLTNARPKVADFPFTTLSPHVGVLPSKGQRSILIADIPGLVEGASQGRGLGHLFLRHIERTRLLLILLSLDHVPEGSPLEDLDILLEELKAYNPELVLRPRIVAINKIDLREKASRDLKELLTSLQGRGEKAVAISALTGENLQSLVLMLEEIFSEDVHGTKGNIGAA
ncbi:MAG: Obg family GTPase, partial [Desulfatiglandales bacterium]